MSEIETPFGEPLPDMTEAELDTAVEVMREEEVMAWANSVNWTVDEYTKTLIIGNVRGFAASPHNITNQFITKFAATINARSQELAAEKERREAAEAVVERLRATVYDLTSHLTSVWGIIPKGEKDDLRALANEASRKAFEVLESPKQPPLDGKED